MCDQTTETHPPGTMAKLIEPDQLPVEAQRCKDRIGKDSAWVPQKQCANCHLRHFHRHQKRPRWFMVVVSNAVYPILCLIYRWRCVNCGVTFTNLPSICVAFKRYLRVEIEKRSGTYVETDPMSYRRVVKEKGLDLMYDDPIADANSTEAEKEMEWPRQLAHTTPYRWIGSIAACRKRLQPVVKQARGFGGLAPRLSSIMISSTKYRSQARKRTLQACCLLLRAMRIVGIRNPTRLATLGSSP